MTLEEVVRTAIIACGAAREADLADPIAKAVRDFLLSDEVVEASAIAMWQQESLRAANLKRLIIWEDEAPDVRTKWRQLTRAALSSIGGE